MLVEKGDGPQKSHADGPRMRCPAAMVGGAVLGGVLGWSCRTFLVPWWQGLGWLCLAHGALGPHPWEMRLGPFTAQRTSFKASNNQVFRGRRSQGKQTLGSLG